MELNVINVIMVMLLCAMTAFLSHMGMAVFHDGIRPVIPEYIEGRMKRTQMASIAFGLSVGFIASVGIGNALVTNLLNPWLLFLATDIIGIAAPKKWLAPILGAGWGFLSMTAIGGINTVLTGMPVDLIGAMGNVGNYIVTGFAIFPIIAIIMQFGMAKGVITAVVVLVFRFAGPRFTTISGDSWTMMVGVIALVALCIIKDASDKKKEEADTMNIFSERVARIKKNLPFLMVAGALIAAACNLHVFAGSDVSMFDLSRAYAMGDAAEAQSLIKVVATNEFMRGLSFIPLIATTAVTTGVYGVAGFTFVYVAGYLCPNPVIAAIVGAVIILVEVFLLGFIGKFLGNFPSMRDASDNIRSAMNTCVEFALLIGSISACGVMGEATSAGAAGGFIIGGIIYLVNEMTGRKIMRMAIGPVAAIVTGIILNLTYLIGLTPLV
ncbi:YhfT family protein [Kineothrix sp. MB12-C1]|uniref:YhfT family protein n=1 Tax=Kineothrix sp. MB12-C1 TaxID=3070215 RepID=UPI0027D1F9AE|nr:YhfT family protein [Kineothrix sp. MB12-C1]WMC91338.1 YhfT family protein [Kineothrix sp. MB12-C1]